MKKLPEKLRDREVNLHTHTYLCKHASGTVADYCRAEGIEVNLKYFDPGYQIRSVQAEGEDAVFCALLAQNAVHAALSGRTDVMIGHWDGSFTHVPIPLATRSRKKVDLQSQLWQGVRNFTCF